MLCLAVFGTVSSPSAYLYAQAVDYEIQKVFREVVINFDLFGIC